MNDGAIEDWGTGDKVVIGDRVFVVDANDGTLSEFAQPAFDNHDAISVQVGNVETHGQNTGELHYLAPHPVAVSVNAVYMDVVIGGTVYTHEVSSEASLDINRIYGISDFINTTLRDIVDDVAEISYKDGYEDGYLSLIHISEPTRPY